MDGWASPWHIIIVAVVFIALFGYRRLPDASKSLARSMRIFKSEMKGFHEDEKPADPATQQIPQLPASPAAPAPGTSAQAQVAAQEAAAAAQQAAIAAQQAADRAAAAAGTPPTP